MEFCDLLFFLTTTNEIIKYTKVLNNMTPYNVICLPFYGKLEPKYNLSRANNVLKPYEQHEDTRNH